MPLTQEKTNASNNHSNSNKSLEDNNNSSRSNNNNSNNSGSKSGSGSSGSGDTITNTKNNKNDNNNNNNNNSNTIQSCDKKNLNNNNNNNTTTTNNNSNNNNNLGNVINVKDMHKNVSVQVDSDFALLLPRGVYEIQKMEPRSKIRTITAICLFLAIAGIIGFGYFCQDQVRPPPESPPQRYPGYPPPPQQQPVNPTAPPPNAGWSPYVHQAQNDGVFAQMTPQAAYQAATRTLRPAKWTTTNGFT
uniref:Uncharacterized protein n=1 Tax=Musca domestica TaxID=7370 RepID=A0A1I8NIY5_MUSDO